MMLFFGQLNAEKAGPNNSTWARSETTTPASWPDSDPTPASTPSGISRKRTALAALSEPSIRGALASTIIYNLNPADNYVLGSMIGNFQDGTIPGKIQFGSGWWFLDQKEGMEWQFNALSNLGLLSRFVGMVTDSRSFMSYPRHEYFRRVLCNLIGRDLEEGMIPDDDQLVGPLIRNVCYGNARNYFDRTRSQPARIAPMEI